MFLNQLSDFSGGEYILIGGSFNDESYYDDAGSSLRRNV
jgi:hypothetical protein